MRRPPEPVAVEVAYFKLLRDYFREFYKEVFRIVEAENLGRADSWREDTFSRRISGLLLRMAEDAAELQGDLAGVAALTDAFGAAQVGRVFGISPPAALRSAVPGFVRDNVSLITDVTAQTAATIESLIGELTGEGATRGTIVKAIQERAGMSERRAKLIARDQVLTLNANIARERHQNLGVTHFIWSTSRDSVVRGNEPAEQQDHVSLEGERFSYANGAVDPRSGETIWPGSAINCRCVGIPDTASLLGL